MTGFQDNKVLTLPTPKERPEHTKELLAMLTYRRPGGSKTERKFIRRFISPLGMRIDKAGNHYKRIGDAPILWSSHTDTVHKNGGRQLLKVTNGLIKANDINSNCLGADCTAGVWMMTEMIKAQVPGLYVFHREEESGGMGSAWLVKNNPELLEDIQFAIAFDRRGTTSVITHQWGSRCCSANFAASLSDAIGLEHKPDSGGSFTDTANYVDNIGECTNLSVGYQWEHQKDESLDIDYIERLREAVLSADFTGLVSERKPGEHEYYDEVEYYGSSRQGTSRMYGSWNKSGWSYDEDQDDRLSTTTTGFRTNGNRTLVSLVREHPEEVADWLEEYGIDPDEIAEAIWRRGGVLRTS